MDRKSGWMPHRAGARGFTLVELMIAVLLLVIVLAVAAPPLRQLVHGNRLRTEASRLLRALNLARSEAVLRNQPVSVCPSSMAQDGSARCGGEFARGWLVFSNADRDRIVDAPGDSVIRAFAAIPAGYSLTNRAGTRAATDLITYLPDGSSRRSRTLLLCAPAGLGVASWSIVLNNVGRPRVARGEGACPS
ncbi:MAG: GspH/FimT family pseudopilin [Halioglobus sp.]|nr:GspH/FimT family pseudopilin [Halioglobus sp.]